MELKDLGERKVIEIMAERYGSINLDDCATVDVGDEFFLVTTDTVNEKTHLPEGAAPYQMGWFIVAINLSDIAAKGGKPVGLTLSLGLPKNKDVNFIKKFSDGADDCAKKFGTKIIGGDTKEMDSITLCGTALGIVKKKDFMPRKGARPGDTICVTGELGGAGVAIRTLRKREDEKALQKILLVNPRVKEGMAAASAGGVTSSMDISDGLASSLYQLSKINDVGFEIHAERIPTAEEAKSDDFSLYSGGDYELLFTVSPGKFKDVEKAVGNSGCKLTDIGTVTKEKKVVLIEHKEEKILENRGYEHFLNQGKNL
ncbi:MAG: thiamine-phosphate kinase [Candidatus Thermoplasmatota archaeon]|nr:thiamine-phosphate kinase [Candidatus Thermoplasmatota archaeon]